MTNRYTIIKHSAKYGLLCLWDAREGIAVTVNSAVWIALKYEEI